VQLFHRKDRVFVHVEQRPIEESASEQAPSNQIPSINDNQEFFTSQGEIEIDSKTCQQFPLQHYLGDQTMVITDPMDASGRWLHKREPAFPFEKSKQFSTVFEDALPCDDFSLASPNRSIDFLLSHSSKEQFSFKAEMRKLNVNNVPTTLCFENFVERPGFIESAYSFAHRIYMPEVVLFLCTVCDYCLFCDSNGEAIDQYRMYQEIVHQFIKNGSVHQVNITEKTRREILRADVTFLGDSSEANAAIFNEAYLELESVFMQFYCNEEIQWFR